MRTSDLMRLLLWVETLRTFFEESEQSKDSVAISRSGSGIGARCAYTNILVK